MQCVVLFLAEENITTATTKVYGTVAGIKVPFSVDNPNACEDQGITCPMIAGKDYTFKTVLPIKSIYPSVRILEILASSQQTSLVPESSSAISVRARFNLVPRALFWGAVTAFWASPRFGHPHSQIPSVLGIPFLYYCSVLGIPRYPPGMPKSLAFWSSPPKKLLDFAGKSKTF